MAPTTRCSADETSYRPVIQKKGASPHSKPLRWIAGSWSYATPAAWIPSPDDSTSSPASSRMSNESMSPFAVRPAGQIGVKRESSVSRYTQPSESAARVNVRGPGSGPPQPVSRVTRCSSSSALSEGSAEGSSTPADGSTARSCISPHPTSASIAIETTTRRADCFTIGVNLHRDHDCLALDTACPSRRSARRPRRGTATARVTCGMCRRCPRCAARPGRA